MKARNDILGSSKLKYEKTPATESCKGFIFGRTTQIRTGDLYHVKVAL